eukprot:Nitzschia sp. Nitz4//scaffold182_size44100//11218//12705//NITZ4_007250-RA/size44100-processed-gene-0.39-mRNA-1//1//CDS//3329539553//1420//frame0
MPRTFGTVVLWLSLLLLQAHSPSFAWSLDDESSSWTESNASDSCSAIDDCNNCSSTYTCHWCSFDNACHARGSIYGCAWGETCSVTPPKENSTCAAQATCSDCASLSRLCHWCDHDNACHSIGSPYGCTVGVDCYSNDRCRRKQPEPIHEWVVDEIPVLPLLVILGTGALVCLILTCCFFVPKRTEGPETVLPEGETHYLLLPDEEEDPDVDVSALTEPAPESNVEPTTQESDDPQQPPDPPAKPSPPPEETAPPAPLEMDTNPDGPGNMDDMGPTTPLLSDDTDLTQSMPLTLPSSSMRRPRTSRRPSCLSLLAYFGLVGLTASMVAAALFYYPKFPEYNVCNDAVAWKKIIQNIAAFKLDASFEILNSVINPNHLTVQLVEASGSFAYNDIPIGTYEIPPVTVEGMAITDVMLLSKVTPDRSVAFELVQAYYKGGLVLTADFNATFQVPSLFGLKYHFYEKGIEIYVNELGPRDLCHCPYWDGGSHDIEPLWL